MAHVAEVIVDVPVMQTNAPYTYIIPDNLVDKISPGMRVEVPFGNGNRHIQGFIVAIHSEAPVNTDLKEIIAPMDLEPVLNNELLELGEVMAQKTFAFRISCYQTMLPSVYRAKYGKIIRLIDTNVDDEIVYSIFKGKDTINFEIAKEEGTLSQLAELQKEGKVQVEYVINDKKTVKTIKKVIPLLSSTEIEQEKETIPSNAKRQFEFLEILETEHDEYDWNTLRDEYKISSQVLNKAVEKAWVRVEEVEVYRDPFKGTYFEKTYPLKLTNDQQNAYEKINDAIEDNRHETFLLKGVTGSGKTEVYLQTISKVLNRGEGALMLVPEIALTPQMVVRFKGRFGDQVAVLHSGLSDSERYDEWRKIESGDAKVVVGARSSVFAPIKNIGLIIVDEEHEKSYKQEENPRYHARDVAIWRAAYHKCPVILGSATPSLESRARAYKNVYTLLELNIRANDKELPPVNVVDMRDETSMGNRSTFSLTLQEQLNQTVSRGEQAILLLNRRGYSSFVMCRDCGFVLGCKNCDISLTLHMDTKTMKCHYCGHEEGIPNHCPECSSKSIRYYGTGTQKVEEELQELMPNLRILRMDNDTTRRKGAYEKILGSFENYEADVLLGTQMIAKGLDFPNVTLVGVINADTSLGLPDFRSAENTFQILTQVSGRAGRGEKPGQVIVQTYNPDHYSVQLAKEHDYDTFFKKEMQIRRLSDYSPYYFLIRIMVSHENEMTAAKKIGEIADYIKPALGPEDILLDPAPKAIARTHNRYHFQSIIKYKKPGPLMDALHEVLSKTQKDQSKGLFISIDPKPMNFI